MAKTEMLNCIDIIRPYIEAVTAEGMPPVQLFGGVGSAALLDPATVIKGDERLIIAPPDLSLPNYRDDGNKRDLETFVQSSSKVDSAMVDTCAKKLIGDRLDPETFEFRDIAWLDNLAAHPFGLKALGKAFLSDRYMPANTVWSETGPEPIRGLFPFSATIDNEALQTWTLQIGEDLEIPVPAPGATVINYLTRSISGLRGKDAKKVQKMATAVFEKEPETVDWIVDGPGSSQFDLARVFQTLHQVRPRPKKITVGEKLDVTPVPRKDLTEHPTFMFREAPTLTQQYALRWAMTKSVGLHYAESMPFVVTAFQKHIEPRISSILHNR